MNKLQIATLSSFTIAFCGLLLFLVSGCSSTEYIHHCNISDKPKIQEFLLKCMEDNSTANCINKASTVFTCREEQKEIDGDCGCQIKVSLVYDPDTFTPQF